MRIYSKQQQYSRKAHQEPKSTCRARKILAAAGIPCTTGRAAGYDWTDLAAWGCIPIEAKGCTITLAENGKQKMFWKFTHKQQREGFEDGFFLLLAWYEDDRLPMKSFVVPTSEKWVIQHVWSRRYGWSKEGQPKAALGLRVDGELWSKLAAFENRFDLIEQRRLEIITALIDSHSPNR